MDTKAEAATNLGTLWAQAYQGRSTISLDRGPAGIDPATIALLIQILSIIIPKLLERCNQSAELLHAKANDKVFPFERWILRREITQELRNSLGWWGSRQYDKDKLVNAAIRAARQESALPFLKTFEG